MPLIARLLFNLVGDLVFDAARSRLRGYDAAVERYFARRAFRAPLDRVTHRTK